MKKVFAVFLSLFFMLAAFTGLCVFLTEKTDLFELQKFQVTTSFAESDGHMILSWTKYPYPCLYKVETYYKTTGKVPGQEEYHLITSDVTFSDSYQVPGTAIPAYYRITAYGIFGKVSANEGIAANPNYGDPIRPIPIFKYTQDKPASVIPYLVWHSIPDGVFYELELLSGPPDNENTTTLSKVNHLYSTQLVFTNGIQLDLRPFTNQPALFYRVRALNLRREPVGVFSTAEEITLDTKAPIPNKPLLNTFDRMPNFKQPLYPVYQWIPMYGANRYEVELIATPPVEENNTSPSHDRAWAKVITGSFSCYDEYPRPYSGKYYWRVRAINEKGDTIGTYSDSDSFEVEAYGKERPLAAAFGDSITHGGGAVSFSPANLEYSYTTYLDFPAINLGHSGDTSHTTLLRFEQDVLPFRPKNLLIMTGSNDLRNGGVSADMVIADLEAIYKKCTENDIRPILMTLPPINPPFIMMAFQTPSDPNWLAKMTAINKYIKSKPYYIDLEPYFYDSRHQVLEPSLANDGLHGDITGKMLMAEIINMNQHLLIH